MFFCVSFLRLVFFLFLGVRLIILPPVKQIDTNKLMSLLRWATAVSQHSYIFHKCFPSWQLSIGPNWGAVDIIYDVPQRWECDILLERSRNETNSQSLVRVCLRFTLWCICNSESIWFNLISVPGHPAILCAFSVTVAYRVRPTDSSANKGV